jgi:hypothetical protein
VTWDLRYEPPALVELRTIPPDNPHIWEEARFKGRQTRSIQHWGIEPAVRVGPLAIPGSYSVRMSAGGQTLTRTFDVIKDPDIAASQADLQAATAAGLRIRDALSASAGLINRLEVMRKQIEDRLPAQAGRKAVQQALRDLDGKLMGVELMLLTRTEMHSDDKWYVEAYKVYLNLVWLNAVVGTGGGDVQGGADFKPTDASLEILAMLEKELAAAQQAFTAVVDTDVAAFNRAHPATPIAVR